jgi:hypothetical protein
LWRSRPQHRPIPILRERSKLGPPSPFLEDAGADVLYRDCPLPHAIDPRYLVELREWVAALLGVEVPRPSR